MPTTEHQRAAASRRRLPRNPARDAIAWRFQMAREDAGYSQQGLADAAGMRRNTIQRIEYSRRPLPLEEAAVLCALLRVSLEWLAHGGGEA